MPVNVTYNPTPCYRPYHLTGLTYICQSSTRIILMDSTILIHQLRFMEATNSVILLTEKTRLTSRCGKYPSVHIPGGWCRISSNSRPSEKKIAELRYVAKKMEAKFKINVFFLRGSNQSIFDPRAHSTLKGAAGLILVNKGPPYQFT